MIAVAFPGQGAQKVGMVTDISALAEEYFLQANDYLNYDLRDLCANGPAKKLSQTQYAQPALLVTCYTRWLDVAHDFSARVFAGHSLGLITAMVAAGGISFADAVSIVAKRGSLMANASGNGGMMAILGLDVDTVEKICKDACLHGYVQIANYNAPGQIVVSGEALGLQQMEERAVKAGARKIIALDVSGPFHSKLMKPVANEFSRFLQEIEFRNPKIPVVSNVKSIFLTTKDQLKSELISQLTSPVRWIDNIHFLESQGVTEFVEVSPNPVLLGLTKRISKGLKLTSA